MFFIVGEGSPLPFKRVVIIVGVGVPDDPYTGNKITEVMTSGGTFLHTTEINAKFIISSGRDAKVVVPYKKNDPLGEGGTVRPYKERQILYKNAENVGKMGIFDALRRTFVHLAQKNLQIRSDILRENAVPGLDFCISFVV